MAAACPARPPPTRPAARRCAAPAQARPPLPGVAAELPRAGEHGAGDALQPLVERDVDGVEQGGDLGVRPAVAGLRLPEPGTVEVRGGAAPAGPRGLRDQVVPVGEQAPEVAQGQLPGDGGQRLPDRLEDGGGDEPVGVAGQQPGQAVHHLVALALVHLHVRPGVEGDGPEGRASACSRSAAEEATAPVGNSTAAGVPSRPASRSSSRVTAPPTPYTSGSSSGPTRSSRVRRRRAGARRPCACGDRERLVPGMAMSSSTPGDQPSRQRMIRCGALRGTRSISHRASRSTLV